jgi:prepilin-type N-terminal cleavage/methylation domain-containing protein
MIKNQSGFTLVEIAIVILLLALLSITGIFVYMHEHRTNMLQASSCKPTQAMVKSDDYDVPCSLIVLLNGPPYASESIFEHTVKPISGSVDAIDPEDGIYGVKVKAGTDEKSIEFLEKQPIVKSVTHDHCCAEPNSTGGAQ